MRAQPALLLSLLVLSGCGEKVVTEEHSGSTTPPYVRPETTNSSLSEAVLPVRVGELGPNFSACNARGTVRQRPGIDGISVRAAPFEAAAEIDALPASAEFFICSRTHDQRWFGIVYDDGGRATDRCGVGRPLPARRDYQGPCAAGWAMSAQIRLLSGVPHQLEQNVSAPPTD